jgi:hypothetical protein
MLVTDSGRNLGQISAQFNNVAGQLGRAPVRVR